MLTISNEHLRVNIQALSCVTMLYIVWLGVCVSQGHSSVLGGRSSATGWWPVLTVNFWFPFQGPPVPGTSHTDAKPGLGSSVNPLRRKCVSNQALGWFLSQIVMIGASSMLQIISFFEQQKFIAEYTSDVSSSFVKAFDAGQQNSNNSVLWWNGIVKKN